MMKTLLVTSLALAISIRIAFAGIFNFTSGDTTYTIVEADPFASGGIAGNTTAVGGGLFSAESATTTTMRDRPVSAFLSGYELVSGATDRVFDNTGFSPQIVATVSGLISGQYKVYAVHLYAHTGTQYASLCQPRRSHRGYRHGCFGRNHHRGLHRHAYWP
ncbi:MAG: hypothetical protein KAU94_04595 [Verrucomicrobia bacterium]|nr:hypothetical protein [Verrucomicrobiota bacterium]